MAAERRAAEAHRKMTAAEAGRALDRLPVAAPVVPEAKVVKPIFGNAKGKDAAPVAGSAGADVLPLPLPAAPIDDSVEGLFRRALDLAGQIERGLPVTEAQRAWLAAHEASPEYRTALTLFNAGMIATGQGA